MTKKEIGKSSEETSMETGTEASACPPCFMNAINGLQKKTLTDRRSTNTEVKLPASVRRRGRSTRRRCASLNCWRKAVMTIAVDKHVPESESSPIELRTHVCLGCGLFLFRQIPTATWVEDPDIDPDLVIPPPEAFDRSNEKSWN